MTAANPRYACDTADLTDTARYKLRVQRRFRPVVTEALTAFSELPDSELFRWCLRSLFGGCSGRPAARALGCSRTALFYWATGKRRIPGWAINRLRDCWSEADRRRKAQIDTREREFVAIIEQERLLLTAAPRLLHRLMRSDPMAQPDALMPAIRARYHRRRQEVAARPLPQPSALLTMFLADPDAALAATLAQEMQQPSQGLAAAGAAASRPSHD